MSIRKEILRVMAESERMMDEGKIPFVLAPGPTGILERLPLKEEQMTDYGLVQGQRINTIIRDAILEESQQKMAAIQRENFERIAKIFENIEEEAIESELEDNFDFRTMMKDENGDEPTKH
jgi:hypothetical protein